MNINSNIKHGFLKSYAHTRPRAREKRPLESEKDTERYLSRRVTGSGGLCLKFSSQTEIGFPDRLILLPEGKVAWAEIKSEGEKPRRLQRMRIDALRALGFRVAVCDTMAAVDAFLSDLSKPEP